jgi:hypothetical protein
MTEEQWHSCTDPTPMLDFLHDSRKASDRKLRLFFCACSRRAWHLLVQPEYTAVETAERYAGGAADAEELREVYERARPCFWGGHPATTGHTLLSEEATAYLRLYVAVLAAAPELGRRRTYWQAGIVRQRLPEQAPAECGLLRDLFGPLPFRPVAVDPSWLAWRGGTIRRLAEAVYEERELPSGRLDAARLAVLADLLEEAGCDNQDILNHCRGPHVHVRGCWVVDCLLGKGESR